MLTSKFSDSQLHNLFSAFFRRLQPASAPLKNSFGSASDPVTYLQHLRLSAPTKVCPHTFRPPPKLSSFWVQQPPGPLHLAYHHPQPLSYMASVLFSVASLTDNLGKYWYQFPFRLRFYHVVLGSTILGVDHRRHPHSLLVMNLHHLLHQQLATPRSLPTVYIHKPRHWPTSSTRFRHLPPTSLSRSWTFHPAGTLVTHNQFLRRSASPSVLHQLSMHIPNHFNFWLHLLCLTCFFCLLPTATTFSSTIRSSSILVAYHQSIHFSAPTSFYPSLSTPYTSLYNSRYQQPSASTFIAYQQPPQLSGLHSFRAPLKFHTISHSNSWTLLLSFPASLFSTKRNQQQPLAQTSALLPHSPHTAKGYNLLSQRSSVLTFLTYCIETYIFKICLQLSNKKIVKIYSLTVGRARKFRALPTVRL